MSLPAGFLLPGDDESPTGRGSPEENRVAVAAYRDECPVLKRDRNKQDTDYPLPL